MSAGGIASLALHAWLSPSFPVGGFAFSSGLEWAVDACEIGDADALNQWLQDLLNYGSLRSDGVLLAASWRDGMRVEAINELALAMAPSSERHLETSAQGSAFLQAVAAAWPTKSLVASAQAFAGRDLGYPISVGLAAAAHNIPLCDTLRTFMQAAIVNLVSAALRLGVTGQTKGQAIVAGLAPLVIDVASWAEHSTLDDLGTCAWRFDIASMKHETQYSRLFRS